MMIKEQIIELIEHKTGTGGLVQTGLKGVQLFKMTEPVRCAPVVYEPSLIIIVGGSKQAILGGERYTYGASQYLCCTMSMPVEAGTASHSPDEPLLGVYITLDTPLMTQLAMGMESVAPVTLATKPESSQQGIALAEWEPPFTDALMRLLQLCDSPMDSAILGEARLKELYYAVLKGQAGDAARRAFGVGNKIARSIAYLSAHIEERVTIDDLAAQVGMSRAVFHRKFKQATTLSPIQFVKSMRLNSAAVKIAEGKNVSEAAMDVGYVSASQFNREFKRLYGQTPKQWGQSSVAP